MNRLSPTILEALSIECTVLSASSVSFWSDLELSGYTLKEISLEDVINRREVDLQLFQVVRAEGWKFMVDYRDGSQIIE